MDTFNTVLTYIFWFMMLAYMIGAYIHQHKTLKERRKSDKEARRDHLRKV
jgi:hypothetical protein